ncbi:transposase [Streptomyces acidicola]|uniref:transposase n=1 Tax=Streptomyces acidicola TaxID=2596892 RepID=UPI00380A8FE3
MRQCSGCSSSCRSRPVVRKRLPPAAWNRCCPVPATAPHPVGVLLVDNSGDRKDGTATAPVGKEHLGSVGKIGRGVVTVTTGWAEELVYYPVHASPHTPAHRLPCGKSDPGFRIKLQTRLVWPPRPRRTGWSSTVAADLPYGAPDSFRSALHAARLPFVMASKSRHGTWACGPDAHTPVDAARLLAWRNAKHPGQWSCIERTFRDGRMRIATWWAAEAGLDWYGPDRNVHLVVATAAPAALLTKATWYLATEQVVDDMVGAAVTPLVEVVLHRAARRQAVWQVVTAARPAAHARPGDRGHVPARRIRSLLTPPLSWCTRRPCLVG